MDALAVHRWETGAPRFAVGTSPAPAGTPAGEGPQEGPQRQLLVGRRGRAEALGGARLADDQAGAPLGDPELLAEGDDGPLPAVRG